MRHCMTARVGLSVLTSAIVLSLTVDAALAHAQEMPTVPDTSAAVRLTEVDLRQTNIDTLTALYLSGQWNLFLPEARTALAKVSAACLAAHKVCFGDDDHVQLFWVGKLATADAPTIFSAVISKDSRPYSRVVPGLERQSATATSDRLFEVFLDANASARFATYYVSKPVPDPLLTQAPAATEKFLGPLFSALAAGAGATGRVYTLTVDRFDQPTQTSPPPFLAIVQPVSLPVARAGVEVNAMATRPLTLDSVAFQLAELEARLRSLGLTIGDAANAFLNNTVSAVMSLIGEPVCVRNDQTLCRNALHQVITDMANARRLESGSAAETKRITDAETALHTYTDGLKPQLVSAKSSLDNSPETVFGFGLLTSLAHVWDGKGDRAKLDKTVLAPDPIGRSLQMVVLNITPWGFQEKSTARWSRDAFVRPYVGAVFSPTFGVTTGMSFMLLSNLGVNVGYARLSITYPEEGLEFGNDLVEKIEQKDSAGNVIKDANGNPVKVYRFTPEQQRDPFRLGYKNAVYVGATYNFK